MGAVILVETLLQIGEFCTSNSHANAELILIGRLATVPVSIGFFMWARRIQSAATLDRAVVAWVCVVTPYMIFTDSVRPAGYYVTLLWGLLEVLGVYAVLSMPLLAQINAALFVTVGTLVAFYFVREVATPVSSAYADWATVVAFVAVNAIGYSISILSKRARREAFAALEHERQARRDLAAALAEIKTLQGILPICSFCKKICNDEGDWSHLEDYISEHTSASLSHGLCPECLKREYPEDYALMRKKGESGIGEE